MASSPFCVLPANAIDALDTLYEPNAVFSQFLGSASMVFFLINIFDFSSCLCFSIISLSFSIYFLLFSLFSFLFFVFSNRLESGVRMHSDRYYI